MDREYVETKLINGPSRPCVLVIKFKTNALSAGVFRELDESLRRAELLTTQTTTNSNKIEGVIFTSDKDKIFLAGADLYELKEMLEDETYLRDQFVRTVVEEGQRIFDRIEKLQVPTVAAIHGMCLGGGAELALACDYRVMSNDKCTKIGWPEVQLGILPAWGGCTRLPEIVGVPNALTAILTGRQYASKPALKMKLADKLTHRQFLIQESVKLIKTKEKAVRMRPHGWIPSSIVFTKAKKNILSKTKGNYPAPLKIIDVVENTLQGFRNAGFNLERDGFVDLCNTSEMHNLLRIFFLQEKSKKLKLSTQKHIGIANAAVVGAGTMGAGIAQWLSSRGVDVLLKDVRESSISQGLKSIGQLYVDGVLKHKIDRPSARDGLSRITTTTTDIPLHNTDIVIEAIVEDLSVKKKVLAEIEDNISTDAIIATNTSALSIDDMASCLVHPERFVGIHFFNPVHKMKLVEVVRGSKTSDATVERAVQFVQRIGKLPVVVKDSPGFVVNRVLVPYLIKAAEMYAEGDQIEAIDSAMVKFGMPMGPFRLMDEIGLDVCYHVANDLKNRLNMHCSLEEIQWRLESGRLGKKSGEGFYVYKKGRSVKKKIIKKVDVSRLVDTMIEEAQKVLDEGVIDDPNMLDFAMIMGTGWAPFRGGPIHYNEQRKSSEESQRLLTQGSA